MTNSLPFFRSITIAASLSLPLKAQYVLKQWNVEDGLPQSTVRCIEQTHDGYLWVGTWNGLARFDGIRMTVFNAANTPDFNPSITFVHEDRYHHLWIGTDGGGLYRYQGGGFIHFDSASGIAATMISSMNEDRSGRMWFGTENGIFVYTGDRFVHVGHAIGFPNTLVTEVLPDRDGSMYVQFVNPVYHVRLSGDSLVILDKPFDTGGYRIDIDSAGALWFGVKGRGLVKRTRSLEHTDTRFANVHPTQVFVPRNQQKWVMTPHGPYVLSGNRLEHFESIDGTDLSSITNVFEDREGVLWLAVEGAGLLRLRPKQVETFTTKDGLETNEVMCGMEDRLGNVWVGTWLGGLVHNKTDHPGKFIPVPPFTNGISVMALCQSRDGTIWVGTWAHGVYTIEHGRVKRFRGKGLTESTSIRAIANDKGNGVWIATVYGTVVHYDGATKTWDLSNGLANRMINSVLVTRSGDSWVGTDGSGITRFSKGTISVMKTSEGLIDDFCHVATEDKDGAIWLTSKLGIQRWKDGTLSSVTSKQGFGDDPAQFIQDDEGNYWIGGTHGIHRIRGQDLNAAADGTLPSLSFLTIGKADGMPVEECSGGSNEHVWKTRDGALWFSTTHGVVRLHPRSVASNPVPPGVTIEEVQVEHRPVSLKREIVLHPQETKIEFRYTGINFSAPDQVRFERKLEGFDDGWRNVGNERYAQYTNLEPGEYIFRVKAANSAGVWNEEGASLSVVVLPTFWQTWWFRILLVVAFLTVGPAVYFYRGRQLTKEKQRQMEFSRKLMQSQEQERQRIANELHDSLGQNLLVLKNKILVALQGKTNGALDEMSDLVSQTIDEVRTISHNLRPHQLDQLGVSKTIRALVKNIGQSSSIVFTADIDDIDGLLNANEDIGLFRIIQENLNNVLKHSEAKNARVLVKRNGTGIDVTMSDDGKGMDIMTEQSREELGRGFGLSGMQERARMFGWDLRMESEPNKGTSVAISIAVGGRG